MADKAISALPTATVLNSSDLFVLSQSNTAKNTTWQTIIGYLATALAGHGGISGIAKTGTSGLADTYTITYADSTTFNFVVTNGKGISSIAKTGTAGLVDTYTITYNDGTTGTFTVDNGNGITSIVKTPAVPPSITDSYRVNYADGTHYDFTVDNGTAITSIEDWFGASTSDSVEPVSYSTTPPTLSANDKYLWHYQIYTFNDDSTIETTHAVEGAYGDTGDASYVWIRYAPVEPTRDSDMVLSPDKWIGIYSGTASTAPSSYTDYTWYQYKGDKGDTGATGDYIEQVVSYGTSTAAAVEPSTWYNDPSSISYVAGNFIWQKVEYTLHTAQTVQAVDKHIIGYIGQNGAGSGTLTQITFNGTVYADDGTGNVSITVDADDVGAIENPSTKSNGQVLTYDSSADEWVAANPTTGGVNTVNGVGVTQGTTNVQLYGTNIPVSSVDATAIDSALSGKVDIASAQTITGNKTFSGDTDLGALKVDNTIPAVGLGLTPTEANAFDIVSAWFSRFEGGFGGKASIKQSSATGLKSRLIVPLPETSATSLGVASGSANFMPAWLKWICQEYPSYEDCIFIGSIIPSSAGLGIVHIPDTSNLTGDLPTRCSGIATWTGNTTPAAYRFGTVNGVFNGANMLANNYVDKTQSVTFSAGTIGTRAQQYTWNSTQIGGTPIMCEVFGGTIGTEFHPLAFVQGTSVYLNIYRCVSTAVSSSRSCTVRIWYV